MRTKRKVVSRERNKLSERAVRVGRRKLAKLQKLGKEKGFIADFAREHGVSGVSAHLALRGKTYKHVEGAVKMRKAPVRKLKTRRK